MRVEDHLQDGDVRFGPDQARLSFPEEGYTLALDFPANDQCRALLERLDAFRQPEVLPDFIAACESDYLGRKGLQDRPYPQGEYLLRAYRAAAAGRGRC